MKIGVIADTHNCQPNIQAALAEFRREGINVLIHCGDMTDPKTAAAFGEFRVIHVLGNGDDAGAEIQQALLRQNEASSSADLFTGEIDGVPLAVIHGHKSPLPKDLARSGLYRFVFYGHSHIHKEETIGDCRLINPGALGGRKPEKRSAFILDLHSGVGRFHPI